MSPARQEWAVPGCAWRRTLGDLPGTARSVEFQGHLFDTDNRSKKGIPLGGIGAGSFMYNLCGSFGPFWMKSGRYEERFLPQAAFHLYERADGLPATAISLATDDVLPAWPRLQGGAATYAALYPRGWVDYHGRQTEVTLQFFSPVIKGNYRETSFPVAVFAFHVRNPLAVPVTTSIMFTFPNAPYTGEQNLNLTGDSTYAAAFDTKAAQHIRLRTGLHNSVTANEELTAVVMSARSPRNPPETADTSWCIAAPAGASHVANWDGNGDGSDIWHAFTSTGGLDDGNLAGATDLPAGAVAQKVTLAPGEVAVLPFVLAWDFPYHEFAGGTRWLRRYTEHVTGPNRALEIARDALAQWPTWLRDVRGWTDPIVDSPAYPDWLKQAALNELYYQVFGGSFWENGCVTKPKRFGARPGQHLSFVLECPDYPFAETLDVRHHAARVTRTLWPHIERDILLAYADFITDTADGSAPHDAGSPDGDPFFVYDAYRQSQIAFAGESWFVEEDTGRQTTAWSEFSPKFIQQCYAYWRHTGDDAFLGHVWRAITRTFHYHITTDTDGDGITNMMSSEYTDNEFFNAVLWLGTLPMVVAMARRRGDTLLADLAEEQLRRAGTTTEKRFWNQRFGFYQFNGHIEAIMGDGLLGQRYGEVAGLTPVLDPDRLTSHYRQVARIAALLPDTDGDGAGDLGMGNVLTPDGQAAGVHNITRHDHEVWLGVTYVLAASMHHWGVHIADKAIQDAALSLAHGVYEHTWRDDSTGYWFNTPEAWDITDATQARAPMYQRARGVWELLMELADPYGDPRKATP